MNINKIYFDFLLNRYNLKKQKFNFININNNYLSEKQKWRVYALNSTNEYIKRITTNKIKNINLDTNNIDSYKNENYTNQIIFNLISIIPLSFLIYYNK